MENVYLVCFFILGLFFGSFFAVVGIRLGREEGFVTGKSHCDHCHHPLAWYDLIPLFSYLSLHGKCRYCKAKISPLLYFIELFTALLFMISFYSFGFSLDFVLALLLISLTMIIMASDFTYLMIPDQVLFFFSIALIIVQLGRLGLVATLWQLGSAFVLFLFMFLLMKVGNVLFKKESLGGGDVKLLFVMGLVLDPFLGLIAIFLASFIALPVSLFLYYRHKEKVIPFGPFLLLALLILYFTKLDAATIFSNLLYTYRHF